MIKTAIIAGAVAGLAAGLVIVGVGSWSARHSQQQQVRAAEVGSVKQSAATKAANQITCARQRRQINDAVAQWAADNNIPGNKRPAWLQLSKYLGAAELRCPDSGIYQFATTAGTPTTCTEPNHRD